MQIASIHPRPYDKLAELDQFEASYFETKLQKLGIAHSREHAQSLFREVKRYVALCEIYPSLEVDMASATVDEVWHQFVLFTSQYAEFCQYFFGRFIHHVPGEAPQSPNPKGTRSCTFDEFRTLYERSFGPLPAVWLNAQVVCAHTCVRVDATRSGLSVTVDDQRVSLIDHADSSSTLCRASLRAQPALQFLAKTPRFFVRELPGLRSDDERVMLCRPLVQAGVLQIVP